MSVSNHVIRKPSAAGGFYPAQAKQLRQTVENLLLGFEGELPTAAPILGGVVPHAGYPYSGFVARYTYNAIRALRPTRIFLIGPSHFRYFPGCSVYDGDAFRTPLGEIPVDTELVSRLRPKPPMVLSNIGHGQEHALEVQLPFLQVIYHHGYKIVPIAMGEQKSETVDRLVDILGNVWEEHQLILASSDLSHYYSYEKAMAMDTRFHQLLSKQDIPGLWKALDRHEIEACGFGPVMVLLGLAAKLGFSRMKVLKYGNSGDVTNDRSTVVGYVSAIISGDK